VLSLTATDWIYSPPFYPVKGEYVKLDSQKLLHLFPFGGCAQTGFTALNVEKCGTRQHPWFLIFADVWVLLAVHVKERPRKGSCGKLPQKAAAGFVSAEVEGEVLVEGKSH